MNKELILELELEFEIFVEQTRKEKSNHQMTKRTKKTNHTSTVVALVPRVRLDTNLPYDKHPVDGEMTHSVCPDLAKTHFGKERAKASHRSLDLKAVIIMVTRNTDRESGEHEAYKIILNNLGSPTTIGPDEGSHSPNPHNNNVEYDSCLTKHSAIVTSHGDLH